MANKSFEIWFNENYPMLATASMLIAFDRTIGVESMDKACEKLYSKWAQFEDGKKPAKPEHWVLRQAIDLIKKHDKSFDAQTIDLMVEEILSSFATTSQEKNLSSQLKSMNTDTRAVSVLRKFLGFAFSDISYIVKLDKATVEGMDDL
jgi:DNA-directed RNA polymerase specialized sigma24 family protein